jgi:hypothetical protein
MHAVCRLVRAPHMILTRIYSAPHISARACDRVQAGMIAYGRVRCALSRVRPHDARTLVSKNSGLSVSGNRASHRLYRIYHVPIAKTAPANPKVAKTVG